MAPRWRVEGDFTYGYVVYEGGDYVWARVRCAPGAPGRGVAQPAALPAGDVALVRDADVASAATQAAYRHLMDVHYDAEGLLVPDDDPVEQALDRMGDAVRGAATRAHVILGRASDMTRVHDYCIVNNAIEGPEGSERWIVVPDESAVVEALFQGRFVSLSFQHALIASDEALPLDERARRIARLPAQRTPPWFELRKDGPVAPSGERTPMSSGSVYSLLSGFLSKTAPAAADRVRDANEHGSNVKLVVTWAEMCGFRAVATTRRMRTGRVLETSLLVSYMAAHPRTQVHEASWIKIDARRGASPDALLYEPQSGVLAAWAQGLLAQYNAAHPERPIDPRHGILEIKTAPDDDAMKASYFAQIYIEMEAANVWWVSIALCASRSRTHLKNGHTHRRISSSTASARRRRASRASTACPT